MFGTTEVTDQAAAAAAAAAWCLSSLRNCSVLSVPSVVLFFTREDTEEHRKS